MRASPNLMLVPFLLLLSHRRSPLSFRWGAVGFWGAQAFLSPSTWRGRNVAWLAGWDQGGAFRQGGARAGWGEGSCWYCVLRCCTTRPCHPPSGHAAMFWEP